MKPAACLLLLVVAVMIVLGSLACLTGDDAQAVAAPPLSLEGYLDEKLPDAPTGQPKMKVDNQACYVCHDNYKEEELVICHGVEEVGCIDCHGKSYDHRDDEDNVTPPEVMYPREKIAACCAECHTEHDVSAAKVIARWQEHGLTETDPAKLVCTDCHFQHRLKRRMVRWDKRTGKLLEVEQKLAPKEDGSK
ncbi:MAG: hypothetical protein HQ567_22840 [Candidatus Nealsonbacteria bacterium]|nr:hypothetical protein [Candidatus Nealsonbacteria bacterium]